MDSLMALAMLSTACALIACGAAYGAIRAFQGARDVAARLHSTTTAIDDLQSAHTSLHTRVRKLHGAFYGARGGRPRGNEQVAINDEGDDDDDLPPQFRSLIDSQNRRANGAG